MQMRRNKAAGRMDELPASTSPALTVIHGGGSPSPEKALFVGGEGGHGIRVHSPRWEPG